MNPFLWLGFILLGWTGPGITRVSSSATFYPEPYRRADEILFSNGMKIEIKGKSSELGIQNSEFDSYWLVHLTEPVRQEWLNYLKASGLEPVCYIAYQTVVVKAKGGREKSGKNSLRQSLNQLLTLDWVDWVGPFLPEYKLAPELTREEKGEQVTIALWNGGTVHIQDSAFTIQELIEDDKVCWVERSAMFERFNRNVQWVMQIGWRPSVPDPMEGRRAWRYGIRGEGMLVGLFDTGINTSHYMFSDPMVPLETPGVYPNHRKIVAYKLYRDASFGDAGLADYHGSSIAGTLAGDDGIWGDSSDLDGVAPDARIYFLDIGQASGQYVFPDDLSEMLDSVRLGRGLSERVYQISGSFGKTGFLSYYRLTEASVDAVCWQDKNFLVIWSAGNEGGARYKLGHPAGAKNCLTVGGCGNGTNSNLIYPPSSAGPTRDERIKPNIVAPANEIWTVDGGGVNTYWLKAGTSFSAPAVSGALTLFRQYLKEGWFPSGKPDPNNRIERPSSALMRAFAICGADTFVGEELVPNERVGWGRLNLAKIMHFPDDSLALTFVDETLGLETGSYDEYEVLLDRREPLLAVLTWTDTAGAPFAEIALVNDLNLELVSPDGNRYRGNQFYLGQSSPNPPNWDERNVEEVVKIARPLVGRWKIRVYARNIYTRRQPYAIVVKAGIEGLPPGVAEPTLPCLLARGRYLPSIMRQTSFHLPRRALLQIYSVDGRLRAEATGGLENSVVRMENLNPGVYFYKLRLSDKKGLTGKFVIVK